VVIELSFQGCVGRMGELSDKQRGGEEYIFYFARLIEGDANIKEIINLSDDNISDRFGIFSL
jgi:hypothetical protein